MAPARCKATSGSSTCWSKWAHTSFVRPMPPRSEQHRASDRKDAEHHSGDPRFGGDQQWSGDHGGGPQQPRHHRSEPGSDRDPQRETVLVAVGRCLHPLAPEVGGQHRRNGDDCRRGQEDEVQCRCPADSCSNHPDHCEWSHQTHDRERPHRGDGQSECRDGPKAPAPDGCRPRHRRTPPVDGLLDSASADDRHQNPGEACQPGHQTRKSIDGIARSCRHPHRLPWLGRNRHGNPIKSMRPQVKLWNTLTRLGPSRGLWHSGDPDSIRPGHVQRGTMKRSRFGGRRTDTVEGISPMGGVS